MRTEPDQRSAGADIEIHVAAVKSSPSRDRKIRFQPASMGLRFDARAERSRNGKRDRSIVGTEVDLPDVRNGSLNVGLDTAVVRLAADITSHARHAKAAVVRFNIDLAADVGNGDTAVVGVDRQIRAPWGEYFETYCPAPVFVPIEETIQVGTCASDSSACCIHPNL